MTIALGVMQLPAGQDSDSNRRYLNGSLPDGGLWTALTRVSNHNHTGGLNGAPISVSSIPDGSITTSKLDPSVLAPYALTDGSKPFTGQVAMNADAIVRDTLYFGAKPAGAADVTVARTGAGALRVDTNLGVGVNPAAWHSARVAAQVGGSAALWGAVGGEMLELSSNEYRNASNQPVALVAAGATELAMSGGTMSVSTAPSVAAGAPLTFTTRMALAQTGTLSLTPAASAPALVWGTYGQLVPGAGGHAVIGTSNAASNLILDPASGNIVPPTDNTKQVGHASQRFNVMYASAGFLQSSSADLKEQLTPLDAAEAMAAVRGTTPVTFDYKPPERPEGWYDLPDDPEQAEQVLKQRLTAAPLEAGARHQAGVVLDSPDYPCDPLFQTGEGQTNPSNSFGILLAAMKQIDQRLTALETP